MKKKRLIALTLVGGLLIGNLKKSFAQVSMPAQGYWVVETNVQTRDHTIVRFYDANDQLIYEERMDGVSLDIKRRKNVKMLHKTLGQVLNKSLVAKQVKKNQGIATAALHKKRN